MNLTFHQDSKIFTHTPPDVKKNYPLRLVLSTFLEENPDITFDALIEPIQDILLIVAKTAIGEIDETTALHSIFFASAAALKTGGTSL